MSTRTDSAASVRAAALAIFAIFGTNGFIFASWAARIPSVTQTLGLSTGEMGAVLLVGAVGSLVSLPLTGSVVDRIGLKATVRLGGGLVVAAGGVIAVGLLAHSVWVVTAGMVLFGSGEFAGPEMWSAALLFGGIPFAVGAGIAFGGYALLRNAARNERPPDVGNTFE